MSIKELEHRFKQVQIERFDPEKLLYVVKNVNESLRPNKRTRSNLSRVKGLVNLQGSVGTFIKNLPGYEKEKFNKYVMHQNSRQSRYGRPGRISMRALSMIRNLNRNSNRNTNRNASRSRVSRRRASRRHA